MRSGLKSSRMKDVTFREALTDPETRPIYIRRRFTLLHLSAHMLTSAKRPSSTTMVDRSVRHCYQTVHKKNALRDEISGARNFSASTSVYLLQWCMSFINKCYQEKFPGAPQESYAACIGRLVYYRYINPAIM